MTKARRFSGAIMQTHLRAPGVLPGGFFKRRGVIGEFLFLGFLVVLAMLRGVLFWFERKKHGKIKKGLKTHCLRGLYAKNTKKPKATPRQFLQNQSLFVFQKNGFQCVIGNKYVKTCLLSMPSLVTNARKGVF